MKKLLSAVGLIADLAMPVMIVLAGVGLIIGGLPKVGLFALWG